MDYVNTDDIDSFLESGLVNLCHAEFDKYKDTCDYELFEASMAFHLQLALEKLLKWELWNKKGEILETHSINRLMSKTYKFVEFPDAIKDTATLITGWATRGRYNTSPGVEKEVLHEVFEAILKMYKERGFDIRDYQ